MSQEETIIEQRDAAEWDEFARAAQRAGDYLGAYDLASRGLLEHPDDITLRFRVVLNLSRSGASDRAAALFQEYGLEASEEEEIVALGARVVREQGFAASGRDAAAQLHQAAKRYAKLYERTKATFPGINAAALYLLSGHRPTARRLARGVLASCESVGVNTYDLAADAAASALILGDLGRASVYVQKCKALHVDDYGAVASTRRQLMRICAELQIDRSVFAALSSRPVIHFSGHMISPPGRRGRFPAEAEASVAAEVKSRLDARNVGFGFGSLACGADILVAEALLVRGAELHVVLPFAIDDFRKESVAPGGDGWLERFDACLRRAASITYATTDQYLGDEALFGHASRLAMGLALLRAANLDAEVFQLAAWDGIAGSVAGTGADVADWRSRGLPSEIVALPRADVGPRRDSARRGAGRSNRIVKAMLFGDAKGFSKLRDSQIPAFVEHYLGAIARTLDRHAARIDFRNTWGDGLYLVMRDARSAMECALDLQAAVGRIDLARVGLPADLGLRIGGHAGPVFEVTDPVLRVRNFMGSHVSQTARMEPVAPEGLVYVTEAFAALIALERDTSLSCEYVGIVPAAKHYGSFRMYVLKRR
jgi:Tetratricopeptide Repeats-Sensor/Adenylate and Guanylate cyclase catalytic domain